MDELAVADEPLQPVSVAFFDLREPTHQVGFQRVGGLLPLSSPFLRDDVEGGGVFEEACLCLHVGTSDHVGLEHLTVLEGRSHPRVRLFGVVEVGVAVADGLREFSEAPVPRPVAPGDEHLQDGVAVRFGKGRGLDTFCH